MSSREQKIRMIKTYNEEQRESINDPSVERTKKTWNKKGKNNSGGMVETRSQKVSEDKRTTLKAEIHRSPAQDDIPVEFGT